MSSIGTSVLVPSIGASLLVIQLIYWMTLFKSTSFYVTLLLESFVDVIEFMILLLIILATFTIAMAMIDNNQRNILRYQAAQAEPSGDDEDMEELTTGRFGEQMVDAFYTQWLLGLGEFEMLGNTDESNDLLNGVKNLQWILFIFATVISQLIMFNTLIAILGDTYGRIMEKRIHYGIQARTEIYADFMYQVKWLGFDSKTKMPYLYVIRPEDEEEGEAWEGAVTGIKKRIDTVGAKVFAQNTILMRENAKIKETVSRVEEQNQDMKCQVAEVNSKIGTLLKEIIKERK